VIRRAAERVEDSDNNQGDSYNEERVFSCILSGLLAPEPFEGIQHGNTFGEERLDIRVKKLHEIKYHTRAAVSRRVNSKGRQTIFATVRVPLLCIERIVLISLSLR
jgi:hypothetical protein